MKDILKDIIVQFTSKKLVSAMLAYSLIVLDGTSALTLDATVVQAAAAALVAHIAVQGAVDLRNGG